MKEAREGQSNLWLRRVTDLTQTVIRPIRDLPEGPRVIVLAALILGTIFLPIVGFAFRAEIWRAIELGAAVIAGLALFLALAFGAQRLLRARRRRRESEQQQRMLQLQGTENAAQRAIGERAELLKAISEGKIEPITEPVSLLARNSEALWYRCQARLRDRDEVTYDGELYVTSLRVSFVSEESPAEMPIGNLNAVKCDEGVLRLIGRTTSGTHTFELRDPELVAAYVARSVKAYHRQVDVGFESDANRQVPQDVKTAVWQRDRGQCVQCGATDYLEFDHIIPFSKGGASTVGNIQLLCRRCNLKKRDSI